MEKKSESEKQHCKAWEEEVYWNHFHVMHFYQILPNHFHDQLVLPTKFADKMKAKLPDKVSLIGPCGSVWEVDLMKIGNLALVGDGWKDFVRTYKLEENFLLLFKYMKDSTLEVLIFDGKSLCEKESAYFVKQFTSTSPGLVNNVKRASLDNTASTEVMEDVDDDDILEFVSTKPMKDVIQQQDLVDALNNTEGPRTAPSDTDTENDHNNHDNVKRASSDNSASTKVMEVVYDDNILEFVSTKPMKDAIQQQDLIYALNNTEGPRTAPSDKDSENDHNNHDIIIPNQSAENVVEEQGRERSPKSQKRLMSDDAAKVGSKQRLTLQEKSLSKSKPVADVENVSNVPDFHITNEPAEDIVGELGKESRSPSSQNRLVPGDAAAEVGGKLRATIQCEFPRKCKPRTKKPKPSGNKTVKKLNQVSARDPITEGNGDTEIFTSNTGKYPLILDHSAIVCKKRSRSVEQASPKSARKLTFRSVSGGKRFSREYRSNRRHVTDSEKDDALRLATQKLSENSFFVVMRPSSVYKRFYLTIPAVWMRKYITRRHQQMILRMGEKTWLTVFHHYRNKGSTGGLATGWKKFALDNNLEEFDVCLFSLASEKNDAAAVLDVEIFRVIPEIVPPSPVICSI